MEGVLEAWGGIDVAVLGLGLNGHLGFNEPGTAHDRGAHVSQLTVVSQGHEMVAGQDVVCTEGQCNVCAGGWGCACSFALL